MFELGILHGEEIEFHESLFYFLEWFKQESRLYNVHISVLQLEVKFLLNFFDSIRYSFIKLHLINIYLDIS